MIVISVFTLGRPAQFVVLLSSPTLHTAADRPELASQAGQESAQVPARGELCSTDASCVAMNAELLKPDSVLYIVSLSLSLSLITAPPYFLPTSCSKDHSEPCWSEFTLSSGAPAHVRAPARDQAHACGR